MKGLEGLEYHTEWEIIDRKTRRVILTGKLEFHIIEIPKVKEELLELAKEFKEKWGKEMEEKKKKRDELLDWIHFLQDPLSDYVIEKTKDNEELREAVIKLKEISEDEDMQRIADLREKAILDNNSRQDYAMRKGREEGLKQGIEEGLKQGIEQGIEQGLEQGLQKGKEEIAKKMLEEKMQIEMIIKITGLTEEEINAIKNKYI